MTERSPQDENLPAPLPERPRYKLALLLLLVTLVTTLWAGSLWHISFMLGNGQSAPDTAGFLVWPNFLLGIPYAVSVPAILLAHELERTPSAPDDLLQYGADVDAHTDPQDGGAEPGNAIPLRRRSIAFVCDVGSRDSPAARSGLDPRTEDDPWTAL
ncbi:MAG: hypothetical protein OXT71_07355 [Acidobacteriota bacterium]|nr:hypothetical protein [Acidobacteriota bacterium]